MKNLCSIWHPLFFVDYEDPDDMKNIDNARRNWNGEDFIWIMPELQQKITWHDMTYYPPCQLPISHLAIPGENLNVIEVIRVDEDKNFYSPSLYFPPTSSSLPEGWTKIPDKLSILWCNTEPVFHQQIGQDLIFKYPFPKFYKNKDNIDELDYKEKIFNLYSLSLECINKSNKDFYVDPKYHKERNIYYCIHDWPSPFNFLLPKRGWAKLLYHHASMINCRNDNQNNLNNVLELFLSKHSWRDEDSYEKLWLLPKLGNSIKDTLFNIEAKFGVISDTLLGLFDNEDYSTIFRNKVETTVLLGWYGYFWWEINNLRKKSNVLRCKRCGNLITGKRSDKEYCSLKDNEKCFRERRAEDKRRERKNK